MVVTFHLTDRTANGLFTCPSKYRLSRTSAISNTADVLILSNVPVFMYMPGEVKDPTQGVNV